MTGLKWPCAFRPTCPACYLDGTIPLWTCPLPKGGFLGTCSQQMGICTPFVHIQFLQQHPLDVKPAVKIKAPIHWLN